METMKHTTLATARLRFFFLATRIWRYTGSVDVSCSDHYQEKSAFQRLRRGALGRIGLVRVERSRPRLDPFQL